MGTAIGLAGVLGMFLALTALIVPPLFPVLLLAAVVVGIVAIRQESGAAE